jgi:hypothetical protein
MSEPKRNRDGSWSVRISCGRTRYPQFLLTVPDDRAAKKRAAVMRTVARQLVRAGRTVEAPIVLKKLAQQPTEAGAREVEAFVAELCKGSPASALPAAALVTFLAGSGRAASCIGAIRTT